ncbi:MAG: T9SS type A sorting domain-containing protein [Bacteroidetes bacterium]|nr:MAG: T9SS type A sorting domain-containing protein [Bacteroidota bacterium]
MNRRAKIFRLNILVALAAALCSLAYVGKREFQQLIFLPGTQPGQADTATSVSDCKPCHEEITRQWSGSMMAHAPKDPLFNAMLSLTLQYTMEQGLDVGEYCLRCHSPSGWLAGRSHPQTVQDMYGSDLDGVHCDACHRMTDPLANDGSSLITDSVPGYGNGMYAVQRQQYPVRGRRGIPHAYGETTADPFLSTSEFCGVCHEVSNPYLTPNARHVSPHRQVMIERTYSEWKLSWFATRGEAGTCQSCHMPTFEGKASSLPGAPTRLDVASHSFTGGNTFAPRSVMQHWNGVDEDAIQKGVEEAESLLRKGVSLQLTAGTVGDSVKARVRVTNLTGHKLPTGFPEGRRVWIELVGRDRYGDIIFESGRYDTSTHDILHDAQLKMYHIEPGISATLAASLGMTPGPSFLAALNDTIYYDNRIPPRGYKREEFVEHRAMPVGYHYHDGQYWDETEYVLPSAATQVTAVVWYQVASKEFIEFTRDENLNNPYDWNSWGEKAYRDWLRFGEPVEMASEKAAVSDSFLPLPEQKDFEAPVEIRLAQNYPNPCNPLTIIEFWISEQSFVSLILYDITGKEMIRLVEQELPAGLHRSELNAANVSSGVYFYRVATTGKSIIKKLLVMK